MKVLVTGGCGFIGTHTCQFFRERGWEVVAFDNLTKFELDRTGYRTDAARDYNRRRAEDAGAEVVPGDIRDLEHVLDSASGCDYIVHTAAQPAMTVAMEDPLRDLSSNVVGTVHVLEAARRHGIPVVTCATCHVYGNRVNDELEEAETRYVRVPAEIGEDAPTMEGHLTPLHASKASAEHYVRAYASTWGVRAGSFRLTGLYGPLQFGGEDHGWVANFVIRNAIGWPITLYGTGKQVRDILYATDVPRAFLAFFERGAAGIYNIGGGREHAISLLECLKLIEETTGRQSSVRREPARFGDLRYMVCDITRARTRLGWAPRVPPAEGVRRLVEWVEGNLDLFAGSPASSAAAESP